MLNDLLEELLNSNEVTWFDKEGNPISEDEFEEEEEIPSNNEWIRRDNDFFPAKNTKIVKELPAGFYDVLVSQGNYYVTKASINTDELIHLPDAKIDLIVSEIDRFWNSAEKFALAKILHKRGVLLHGAPGCGKTSTIHMVSEKVVERGGLIFHVRSTNDLKALIKFLHEYLRDIQPNTPIVVVIEDIDNLVDQDESLLLNFLSGKDEVNHCVIVATTNRIHELNDLLQRPTRFDWVIELNKPSADSRKIYLESKNLKSEFIEKWVKATDQFTIAQLKELFIAVTLLDNDFDAVIKKLKDQEKNIKNSTYIPKGTGIGFK